MESGNDFVLPEVQHFVSLHNFFMSTYTLEERHFMEKAKCYSKVTGFPQLTINVKISCLLFSSLQCRTEDVPQDGVPPGNRPQFPRKKLDSELSRGEVRGYFPKLQQLLCLS